MTIKFGSMLSTARYPGMSERDVIKATIDAALAAERLGYESVWTLEHHFTNYGLNGSAIDLATFILGRTTRLKVGTAITTVPLYHPLRLAEEVAMLDHLSDGRFIFGVGRGHFYKAFQVFGVPQAKNHLIFREYMDLIKRAWTEDKVGASGEFIKFDDVPIYPKPFTSPHPPVRVASTSPSTIEWAAKNGYSMLLDYGSELDTIVSAVELWAQVAEAHGHHPDIADHAISVLVAIGGEAELKRISDVLTWFEEVAEVDAGLGRDEVESLPNYERHFRARDESMERGEWESDKRIERLLRINAVGSAEEVANKIQSLVDATGVSRVNISHEAFADRDMILEQMRLFSEEVMPHIQAPAWDYVAREETQLAAS
jgi:alkanal monooxygenase alpha chain